MKKSFALLLATALVLSALVGCAAPAAPAAEPAPAATTEIAPAATEAAPAAAPEAAPAEAAKKVYYSVLGSDHSSLNFLDNVDSPVANVAKYCMSYLYRQYPNADGNGYVWICDIAAEEPIKVDDNNWQIKIRQDAKWNNGDPINADTFMFTFKEQLNPVMMPRMSTFLSSNSITILNAEQYSLQNTEGGIPTTWEEVGIKKVDDYTIQITTVDANTADQVMNHFYNRNSVPCYEPLWKECLSADGLTTSYGADLDHFMGCGPYIFTNWTYDSVQTYTKNPDHWMSDYFHYDEIQYRVVPEQNARIELWEQGELDIFVPNADTLETYIDDPRLVEYGSNSVYHLDINCMNPNNPISGSDNYRKAIYHAIDRETVARNLFGYMEPAGWYVSAQAGILSEGARTFRDSTYGNAIEEMVASWSAEGHATGFNPALALEYFNKACEECGVSADTVIPLIIAYDPSEVHWDKTAQYLQEELPKIFEGRVAVEIKNYSGISTTEYKKQGAEGWDLSPNDWARSVARNYPYEGFYYFTSTYSGAPNNYFNDDFDAQFAYCRTIQNGDYETLLQETQKLEEIYLEHVVQCPVVQDVVYELHSDRIELPVYTYIPGFGWGEEYGDIVAE